MAIAANQLRELFDSHVRKVHVICVAVVVLYFLPPISAAHAFDFEDVSARAKKLAESAYRKPDTDLPADLKGLSDDQYHAIRYKQESALWRSEGLPFEAAFFPRGGMFREAVKINEVDGATVREIKFDPNLFDYGSNKIDASRLRDLGFAGLRIHYPVNQRGYKDEILSFLGASYFRALGKSQFYGASARGLAVDTAQSSGEEFPRFTEFWLVRPEPGAKRLVLYALLDSPRVTGAYRFVVTPGEDTVVEVKARLYLRDKIALVGIAPLTSMFFFGANQHTHGDDYRPEVHDSDGLSVHSGNGEWLWRPLINPKRLQVTSFASNDFFGFGLMQRDRKFEHYEELGTYFQARPSIWVEPNGKWGPGRVELVEIPEPDETNDNIAAYWVSSQPLQPGEPRDFEYRLHWQKNVETRPAGAWVAQTLRGRAYTRNPDDSIGFLIDFDGPALRKLPPNAKPEPIVSADANGKIVETNVYPNDINGGWRLGLRMRRLDNAKAVEIRAQLRAGDEKESETWSYILTPE